MAVRARSKFNERFVLIDGPVVARIRGERPDENPWSVEPNVICSLQLARLDNYAEDIAAAPWDLVIVDEAHHARRTLDLTMPSLTDFRKRLSRGPATREPPSTPCRARPSRRLSNPAPLEIELPAAIAARGRTSCSTNAICAIYGSRSAAPQRPSLDRVRSKRSEDPESRATDAYQLLDALRDKVGGMLLLTATPMQPRVRALLDSRTGGAGLFNGFGDFSSSAHEIAAINRAVTALRSDRPLERCLGEARVLLDQFAALTELSSWAQRPARGTPAGSRVLSRCHRLARALVRNRKAEIGGFTSRVAHIGTRSPGEDPELKLQADSRLHPGTQRMSVQTEQAHCGGPRSRGVPEDALQLVAGTGRISRDQTRPFSERARGGNTDPSSDDPEMLEQEQRQHACRRTISRAR